MGGDLLFALWGKSPSQQLLSSSEAIVLETQ